MQVNDKDLGKELYKKYSAVTNSSICLNLLKSRNKG